MNEMVFFHGMDIVNIAGNKMSLSEITKKEIIYSCREDHLEIANRLTPPGSEYFAFEPWKVIRNGNSFSLETYAVYFKKPSR
jgi:hypothetical protein